MYFSGAILGAEGSTVGSYATAIPAGGAYEVSLGVAASEEGGGEASVGVKSGGTDTYIGVTVVEAAGRVGEGALAAGVVALVAASVTAAR